MPVTSSNLQADLLKKALLGCAAVATVVTAFSLLIDPTSAMNGRLDAIEPVFGKALIADAGRATKIDAARMAQAPIFVMTSGAAAYKEKSFQLFGVSVSSKRKAALVSIDGAAAAWMIAGTQNGDIRLLDVGGNGAVFETPVGTRNVALTDAPAAADPKAPAQ